MFNVLDMHNKYTVKIFIVSLYKITKIRGLRRGLGGTLRGVRWGGGNSRETLSLGPRPGKTAQKPLKNRSNLA